MALYLLSIILIIIKIVIIKTYNWFGSALVTIVGSLVFAVWVLLFLGNTSYDESVILYRQMRVMVISGMLVSLITWGAQLILSILLYKRIIKQEC